MVPGHPAPLRKVACNGSWWSGGLVVVVVLVLVVVVVIPDSVGLFGMDNNDEYPLDMWGKGVMWRRQ